MPVLCGVVQSFGQPACRRATPPIGSTTAPAALSRCASAGGVITATGIAPMGVLADADGNPFAGPGGATSAAAGVLIITMLANVVGVSARHRK